MVKIRRSVCERANCKHWRDLYDGLCCEQENDYYGNIRFGMIYMPELCEVPKWCDFAAEHIVSQKDSG